MHQHPAPSHDAAGIPMPPAHSSPQVLTNDEEAPWEALPRAPMLHFLPGPCTLLLIVFLSLLLPLPSLSLCQRAPGHLQQLSLPPVHPGAAPLPRTLTMHASHWSPCPPTELRAAAAAPCSSLDRPLDASCHPIPASNACARLAAAVACCGTSSTASRCQLPFNACLSLWFSCSCSAGGRLQLLLNRIQCEFALNGLSINDPGGERAHARRLACVLNLDALEVKDLSGRTQ